MRRSSSPTSYHADGWSPLINQRRAVLHVIVGEPASWILSACAGSRRSSSHVEEHLDAAKPRITHLGGGVLHGALFR